ncbi:hypothetical protein [Lapidilactobacillus wuchangensis]|uniref:hypothetical protein n=1 Tax=Lapidilactobacillus wuchangensis TaxID=2486001 RepID=UPI000F76EF07|nr:hypothetical protein [Lapidilactobacillus wuchangensis]
MGWLLKRMMLGMTITMMLISVAVLWSARPTSHYGPPRATDNVMKDCFIKLRKPYAGIGSGNDVTIVKVDDSGQGWQDVSVPQVEKVGWNHDVIVYRARAFSQKSQQRYYGVIYQESGLNYQYDSWKKLQLKQPAVKGIKLKYVYQFRKYRWPEDNDPDFRIFYYHKDSDRQNFAWS